MRKLIVNNIISLDGFYEGPDGNVMALPMDPSFAPQASDDNREISRLQDSVEKVVVSDSLTVEETEPWRDITRVVRRDGAHEAVAELKAGQGSEILVFGSRTLWNDLLAAGLVDELHLWVGAKVLGGGTPAFTAPPPAPLRLIDVRTGEGTSNVLVRYDVG